MLEPIELRSANYKSFHMVAAAEGRLGRSSNMLRILAHSPTILRLYLESERTFERTQVAAELRTLIAITVSQISGSEYTLALAEYEGDAQGLSREELERARSADASDAKAAAALRFAARVVRRRGRVTTAEVGDLRAVGFVEQEIVELIAIVSFNLFRDYLNLIAKTTADLRLAQGVKEGGEERRTRKRRNGSHLRTPCPPNIIGMKGTQHGVQSYVK